MTHFIMFVCFNVTAPIHNGFLLEINCILCSHSGLTKEECLVVTLRYIFLFLHEDIVVSIY